MTVLGGELELHEKLVNIAPARRFKRGSYRLNSYRNLNRAKVDERFRETRGKHEGEPQLS